MKKGMSSLAKIKKCARVVKFLLMKKWQLKKKSFFARLLVSNIAIATVCALAMFSLFAFQSLRDEQKRLHQDFLASAQSFSRDFAQMTDSLDGMANNLVFYQNIQPFSYRQHASDAMSLIHTLNGLKASNPFLDDIYVYFYQDVFVYTPRNSMRISALSEKLGLDLSPTGELSRLLEQRMGPVYRPGPDGLVVLYPFYHNYQSRGMILFMISERRITQIAENDLHGAATLIFAGDTPLYPAVLPAAAQKLLEGAAGGILSEKAASQSSFSWIGPKCWMTGDLISSGLYFVRITSERGPLTDNLRNSGVYAALGLLCAAVVFIFTFIVARKNYQPVRALRDSLSGPPAGAAFEEFQLFLSQYTGLQEKNRKLERDVREKFELEQTYLLQCLLSGNTSQYEDFMGQALDLNIDLGAQCHLLASVSGPQPLFLEGIQPLLDYRYRYAYPLSGAPGETLYIVGCDETPDPEALEEINRFEHMAISAPVGDVLDLHYQYLTLRIARSMSAGDRRYDFAGEALTRYNEDFTRLSQALREGDAPALSLAVAPLETALRRKNLSEATAKYLCFHIFYLYKNYIDNHFSKNKGLTFSPEALLTAESSPERLADALRKETDAILRTMDVQKDTKSRVSLSIDSILAYIQQHYTEPVFSLQMVANAFDVSPSYLSAFFKDNYQTKMLDYCTLLRLEKAQELLLSTDLTLSEISRCVGYYNTSSFIRRFKQVLGVTPGEYKKQNVPASDPPA